MRENQDTYFTLQRNHRQKVFLSFGAIFFLMFWLIDRYK